MKLFGKYTINKQNKKIQQNNKLTIFGALQIARFLKRDIVFPKINNKPYGYIKSYGGQYKKVSVINGSNLQNNYEYNVGNKTKNRLTTDVLSTSFGDETVETQTNIEFDSSPKKINISNQYSKSYVIDDNYSTYVKMTFANQTSSSRSYFDINLNQPLNIGKIGLMAKIDASYEDKSDSQYFYRMSDWTVYFRPQGVRLQFLSIGVIAGGNLNGIKITEGDYIRVYNVNYPLHNGKPYYIMNKVVQVVQNNVAKYNRCFYCLHYNNIKHCWSVKNVTDVFNKKTLNASEYVDGYKTIDKYIFSKTDIENFDTTNIVYTINTPTVLQKTETAIQVGSIDESLGVSSASILLNRNKINKWIKPVYRLHNYLTNFYTQQTDVQTRQYRNMQLISDFGSIYDKENNDYTTLNYSIGDSDFNEYLVYSSFSFQSISNISQLYNFKPDNYQYQVDFCNQQLVGFVPYIDGVRFCKTNSNVNDETWQSKEAIFYTVDIFVKTPTPYNPIKIALTQGSAFTDENSWFVDSIQKVGDNKIVFSKALQPQQGITQHDGYRYIGLFGNFDGHLDGTTPSDIIIKESNCFSKAQFAVPWSKDNEQSVVITYELTIGD